MNSDTFAIATVPPAGLPGAGRTGSLSLARRMANLVVVATIATAFGEVVLNPAAAFSAVHFWLALFVAAATRGARSGDACRN